MNYMDRISISNKITCAALMVVILSFAGCVSISSFDQYAYAQTTSVKVDALEIMDLATDDYGTHKSSVKEFQTKLKKVYEYEKNRPKNDITVKLWDKLLDTNGHLLGGFLNWWEKENKLNETFVKEEKRIVDKAFDQIAGLESKKIKSSDISK